MYSKRILMIMVCWFTFIQAHAQVKETIAAVDTRSLSLYNAAQWKTLLVYGKESIASGTDFPLLRMRMGYAAYMMGNFSQSLIQYRKVLEMEPDNSIALYYVYLSQLYLNNLMAAKFYSQNLPDEVKASEKIKGTKLSGIQAEFSNRMPDDTARRNAQYARIGADIDLGYRLQLQQSVAYYTLIFNTPAANNKVYYQRLNQPEYYAKATFQVSGRFSLLGAYHYISDQFSDTTINANIFLGGIKYSSPYFNLQANGSFGNFYSKYNQFDGILSVFPLGNMKLYSISRISVGTQTNFTQILGAKINKAIWMEGHTTIGEATYLFDRDALYVKNDPDPLHFRCGAGIYVMLSNKTLLNINYTFEQKSNYLIPNNYYYQHSINGGLSWKF